MESVVGISSLNGNNLFDYMIRSTVYDAGTVVLVLHSQTLLMSDVEWKGLATRE